MNVYQQDESLQERLARLEGENAALRARLESPPPEAPSAEAEVHRGRGRWWTVLAVVLVVLGCLLAPLAVIGGWGKTILTDTDAFVATYAPLARDPAVQSYIVDQAATERRARRVEGTRNAGHPELDPKRDQRLRRLRGLCPNLGARAADQPHS